MSHLTAVSSLRDTYEAVITDLENATASGQDKVRIGSGPSAAGLIKKLKKPSAVRVVHFLCDVLKPVTQLALTFEKNDVELTTIHPRLQSTILTLNGLRNKDGVNTLKSEKLINSLKLSWEGNSLEEVKNSEKKFIDSLISNINLRLQNTEIIDKLGIFQLNNLDEEASGFHGNDEMLDLAEHFNLDTDEALYQWDLFKTTIANQSAADQFDGPIATTKAIITMRKTVGDIYSNVLMLAAAAAVLPLSTSEVERMFSHVKRTITILRNRTKVEKMSKLLMITQNKRYIDIGSIADRWLAKGNRRLARTKK